MNFSSKDIHSWLDQSTDAVLDTLPYGVIGIDHLAIIQRYNLQESKCAMLASADVIGRSLFNDIARCMNNALIAGRLSQAIEKNLVLDVTMDYVLAFKSGAGPVEMRLLFSPDISLAYLLIRRLAD